MPLDKLPAYMTEAREDAAQNIPKWRRYLHNHSTPCPDCGYDLHKATTDNCPECGRMINFDVVWPDRWRTAFIAAATACVLATLLPGGFLLRGVALATSSTGPALTYPVHTRLWIAPAFLLIVNAVLLAHRFRTKDAFRRRSPDRRASSVFWSWAALVFTAGVLLLCEVVL